MKCNVSFVLVVVLIPVDDVLGADVSNVAYAVLPVSVEFNSNRGLPVTTTVSWNWTWI